MFHARALFILFICSINWFEERTIYRCSKLNFLIFGAVPYRASFAKKSKNLTGKRLK